MGSIRINQTSLSRLQAKGSHMANVQAAFNHFDNNIHDVNTISPGIGGISVRSQSKPISIGLKAPCNPSRLMKKH